MSSGNFKSCAENQQSACPPFFPPKSPNRPSAFLPPKSAQFAPLTVAYSEPWFKPKGVLSRHSVCIGDTSYMSLLLWLFLKSCSSITMSLLSDRHL